MNWMNCGSRNWVIKGVVVITCWRWTGEKGTNFQIATSGFHRFSADQTGPKARRLTISIN
jgi:hypothetical protein